LPLTPTTVLALAERDLGRELTVQASLLGRLIVLAVGAGLLDLLGRALGRQEAARLGATVVHLALVAMALGSFTLAFALARTIVADLDSLMEAILPLMIGLLAAMGAVTSAALFQPLMFGAVELIGSAVASVALPLLYVAGVLDVVGRITPYRLEAVAGLLRTVGLWVLGAVLTAFLGVVVVAGSLGPVTDGLALKAGKFLANALIPVVGKMFADATEMVMGTSLVLKNAVGAAGLVALLLLLVLPVMKLLALSFTYRLAGSAVAPVGAGPVPDVLASMAGTLLFVAVAVGAMAMMCFIAMAALLSAGSAGVLP
jgi:stage III sporulation protein AE